uniref:DUF3456 domain-containing protein n=1 Tax=Rhabditophanes sp. KR3021 TaxID=114890 RepID=A0AC35UGJ2_9BILA
MISKTLLLAIFLILVNVVNGTTLPSKCESCILMISEFNAELAQIKLPLSVDTIDKAEQVVMDVGERVCAIMIKYRIDSSKQDLNRFVKGTTDAMLQLKSMRDKGVKINLEIPEELWDAPGIESSQLKLYCESILEEFEEAFIGSIYNNKDLKKEICVDKLKCNNSKKEL